MRRVAAAVYDWCMNIASPDRIETSRLILRPPTLDDAPAIFARWAQDRDVVQYLTWRPHTSVEGIRAFLQHITALRGAGQNFTWVLVLKDEPLPIGMLGARPGPHGLELGYVLAKNYWNRGYMTEAVKALMTWALAQSETYRVWAVCDVENRGSARVLEKAGLRCEGVLRRWNMHPNASQEPRDCFVYAIVK